MSLEIYTDGGSRGNPGPAACGVVIGVPFNKKYSSYMGEATNNEAEYEAVALALKKITQLAGKEKIKDLDIKIFMDSKLAVEQLSGRYKIKSENIVPLFIKIHNLLINFGEVEFVHILREKNKTADSMVNYELDKQLGKHSLFG